MMHRMQITIININKQETAIHQLFSQNVNLKNRMKVLNMK